MEVGEETRGRELLRLLLQAHINDRGHGDVGPAVELLQSEHGKRPLLHRQKGLRRRSILTIFGKVYVERVRYSCRRGRCIHPLDAKFQLPGRSYSYELQSRLVKRTVQGPFDEAVESIQELTEVRIPKRSAENLLLDACFDFESFYSCREGMSQEGSGPILVGSVDCKGIPMVKSQPAQKKIRRGKGEKANKKRMATVAAVFTQHRFSQTV